MLQFFLGWRDNIDRRYAAGVRTTLLCFVRAVAAVTDAIIDKRCADGLVRLGTVEERRFSQMRASRCARFVGAVAAVAVVVVEAGPRDGKPSVAAVKSKGIFDGHVDIERYVRGGNAAKAVFHAAAECDGFFVGLIVIGEPNQR